MNDCLNVIKEQYKSFPLIIRLAIYDTKSKYQLHYLGVFWQLLNPLIQILAYWFVFGVGIKKGAPVDGYPFIIWMLAGIIPWFFISAALLDGSNSIYRRINLVAKMNFPVSALPSVSIISNLFSYVAMMLIFLLILILNGNFPTLHWLQFFYYLFCLIIFMFSLSLFNSTVSVLIRDYHQLLQAGTRLLMFLTPIFWNADHLGNTLTTILKLNPFYYLIDGLRNSFLNGPWFFTDIKYGLYFWLLTLFLFIVGSSLHMKFRNRFVDFL